MTDLLTVTVSPTGKRTYTAPEGLARTIEGQIVGVHGAGNVEILLAPGATISGREAARLGVLPAEEAALYPTDDEREAQGKRIVAAQKRAAREGRAWDGTL
jgi:hypothetical protein